MSNKPIFVATHPRACSTAFERVFMTQRDTLQCIHEPFGDAFYYGPERLGSRYEDDEKARTESGFSDSTYKTIFDRIERENSEGKRVFIKDITHYLVPPSGQSACLAPSLHQVKRGVGTDGPETNGGSPTTNGIKSTAALRDSAISLNGINGTNGFHKTGAPFPYGTATEPNNPTVVPRQLLEQFHFTFLIRHPRNSIPSYFRCTIPPLDHVTGFYDFMPQEAGYDELRRVFDYLKDTGLVGPKICGQHGKPVTNGINGTNGTNGHAESIEICVVDADDLLDDPEGIMKKYCDSIGYPFSPSMLEWDNEEQQKYAKETFEKWPGFHDDAIESTDLKPRAHKKKAKTDEQYYYEWVEKYGEKGAKVIQQTVADNVADYEYLKQFAIKA